MKKLLVLVFSCVVLLAASGNVFAANIVYTISGVLNGELNRNGEQDSDGNHIYEEFEQLQVTWHFYADRTGVLPSSGGSGVPPMLLNPIIWGTVEIDGLLPQTNLADAYDIGASIDKGPSSTPSGAALAINGVTDPVIWLENTLLDNYNLETEIGPLTDCAIDGAPTNGPYRIEGGGHFNVWAKYLDDTVTFQANLVPIPSSIFLLGAGLAALAGIRKKFKRA